jgi:hypothetical protein
MKSLTRALMLGVTLTSGALTLPAVAQEAGVREAVRPIPTLNLSAYGEVKAAPDMATITTGVQTDAATAAEAMALNRSRMNAVVASLRRAGVAEADIQTSGLNLNAVYDYAENQPPRLRGYQVSNQVAVVVRDLDRVGAIADVVVETGANQIGGISFGLSDPTAAENAARREAVEALGAKAQLYSQALNVRLVGLTSLSEGGGYAPPPPMPMYARVGMVQSADATSVSPGQLSVRIDIQGVYEIAR